MTKSILLLCVVSECHWGKAQSNMSHMRWRANKKQTKKTLMACACKHKFAKWRSPVCLLHCGREREQEREREREGGEERSQYFTYYFWDDDWHIKSIAGEAKGWEALALWRLALVWCGKGSRKGRHTTGACSPGACLRPCRSARLAAVGRRHRRRRRQRASSLATTAAPFRLIIPITTHI